MIDSLVHTSFHGLPVTDLNDQLFSAHSANPLFFFLSLFLSLPLPSHKVFMLAFAIFFLLLCSSDTGVTTITLVLMCMCMCVSFTLLVLSFSIHSFYSFCLLLSLDLLFHVSPMQCLASCVRMNSFFLFSIDSSCLCVCVCNCVSLFYSPSA